VNALLDKNDKVKESGAKLIAKIAEFHPDCVLFR
jgi:hypothetical protein